MKYTYLKRSLFLGLFYSFLSILTCFELNADREYYGPTDPLDFVPITQSSHPEFFIWQTAMQKKYPIVAWSKFCWAVDKNNTSRALHRAEHRMNGKSINYVVCPQFFVNKKSDSYNAYDELELLDELEIKSEALIYAKVDSVMFPMAYEWYQKMIAKYPQAGLDKVLFVVALGDGWFMSSLQDNTLFIACPFKSLKQEFTAEDEWALLHEAGHVKNHKAWSFFYKPKKLTMPVASGLTGVALLLSGVCGYENIKQLPYIKDSKIAVAGVSAVAVYGLYKMIKKIGGQVILRIDERSADKFALQQGDKNAQLEEINFFTKLIENEQKSIDVLKKTTGNTKIGNSLITLIRKIFILLDPHPTHEARIVSIKKTLQQRFNLSVA